MTVGSDKLRLLRRIPSVRFEEEMRGYSKVQVDRVLETLAPLADEIEALQQQLDEANARADEAIQRAAEMPEPVAEAIAAPAPEASAPDGDFDQTLRNTLLLAQRTADQTVRDAESKAEKVRSESTARADSIMADARTEAKELKGEAHAQREQMLADAESERAQLLADALEHAETRKLAIEEELLSEQGIRRNDLLVEISQLERGRDELSADVQRFEEFLASRRDRIRDSLQELEEVLDDPTKLSAAEVPEPAEVDLLDPEELTGLSVDSHSIGTLGTEVDAAKQQAADVAFSLPGASDDTDTLEDSDDYSADEDSGFESTTGGTSGGEVDAQELDAGEASSAHEASTYEAANDESEFEAIGEPTPPEHQGVDAQSPADHFATAIESEPGFDAAPASEDFEDFGEIPVDALDTPLSMTDTDVPVYTAPSYEAAPAGQAPTAASEEQVWDPSFTQGVDDAQPDPFATGGYDTEIAAPDPSGIAASVTPDSVFSSVPETADPSAYTSLDTPDAPAPDPTGLGIDVESPFAQPAEAAQPGLGGLAEQARNRLASRVSRLRDTAVPESIEGQAEGFVSESVPSVDFAPETQPPPPAPVYVEQPAPVSYEPPAPTFDDAPAQEFDQPTQGFPPPPESGQAVSTPAFASDPVDGAEWSAPDPSRPVHPDAQIEDLPPDDPFLDELRQMTDGQQPEGDDETLNRFLSEEGEKEGGGGWFGRRSK